MYNAGSGIAVSIEHVLDLLRAECKVPVEVVTRAERLRPADAAVLVADATKLRRTTGWAPTFELKQTLRDTLAAARVMEVNSPRQHDGTTKTETETGDARMIAVAWPWHDLSVELQTALFTGVFLLPALIALQYLLLPPPKRQWVFGPSLFYALYIILLGFAMLVDDDVPGLRRGLDLTAYFVLLAGVGRSVFALVFYGVLRWLHRTCRKSSSTSSSRSSTSRRWCSRWSRPASSRCRF